MATNMTSRIIAPATSPSTTTAATNDNKTATIGTSASLVGSLVLIGIFIIIVCLRKRMRNKDSISRGSISDFSASASSVNDPESKFDIVLRQQSQSDSGMYFSYWNEVEPGLKSVIEHLLVDSDRLELRQSLGQGQFGCVYEAALNREARASNDYGNVSHEKVAVKTLRGTELDVETVEAFLKEGLIMRDFLHQNVLTLLGVALAEGGIPMIILPFMDHGNLKSYIGKPNLVITVRELLGFGQQVAEGMHYLSSHKFVHRDLAARNCMLNSQMEVKVADFGLSRDIYTKDYYTSSDKFAKLPVKWMAIESLTKSVYTTKSDVWSYGVLLWELLTRGATPYPDVSNWEVRNYIQSGRRMQQPETCPDEIFAIMLRCWEARPEERPTFEVITVELSDILHPVGVQRSRSRPQDEPAYINLFMNVDVPSTPTPLEELPNPFSP